ncbi:hypothetical protein [Butyrivibrio sp. AE2015]|uniref:hypothetical protein n=1 Tax=Butyrivibrio sp. AE2015 TaxID=1280663 RepID=UPI0003B6EECA|nr:hypothetical protein [Butyrivibrio sp. AE2015]
MGIYKLKPACKDYLWGDHKLVDDFGIEYDGDVLAELPYSDKAHRCKEASFNPGTSR